MAEETLREAWKVGLAQGMSQTPVQGARPSGWWLYPTLWLPPLPGSVPSTGIERVMSLSGKVAPRRGAAFGQLRNLNPQLRVALQRLNRKRPEDRAGAASRGMCDRRNCSPGLRLIGRAHDERF